MSVFFVSVHLDISVDDFKREYVPRLTDALATPGARFVLGDAAGADAMALPWLMARGAHCTVYHIFGQPRSAFSASRCVGGFKSDAARDAAMTAASTEDIAWVRSEAESRALYGAAYRSGRVSGTQKNLDRRAAGAVV